MTINSNKSDFIVEGGLWDGYTLYNLYKEAHTPFEWHAELFRYAKELDITLFSTPFDETAVDLLDALDTPAYKIASFELADLPLIHYVAKKGKPILMSTGLSSEAEISEALEMARSGGCNSLLLFHCISSYPTPIQHCNLKQILKLKETFNVSVGLSDHSIGNIAAIAAVALGACAIEKHFTLCRDDKGPDSEFSAEPAEFRELVKDTEMAWEALGVKSFIRPNIESNSSIFKRSIYFIADLKSGEKIKATDIRRIRPGFGIPPKYFHEIIGKSILKDVQRGDPVTWEILSKE